MAQIKVNWDLKNYYSDIRDKNIDADLNKLSLMVDDFVSNYKWKIINFNSSDFLSFFEFDDKITYLAVKVWRYLSFLSSLDTQNQLVLKKNQEFDNFITDLSNKLLFVDQEIKTIWYDKLISFSNDPKLVLYKNRFVQKANNIKYILDKDVEYALNVKSNAVSNLLDNLHDELTWSFSFKLRIDWKIQNLTEDQVRTLRLSPDVDLRKKSWDAIRKKYQDKKVQITLWNLYASIVKDWVSELKLRWHSNVMAPRNLAEEMTDNTVDMLLEQVSNNYYLYQEYNLIKASLLGNEKLNYFDVFAPINIKEKKVDFQEWLNLFMECMHNFDDEFLKFSQDMFINWQVDVFPSKWKRWWAFASYDKDHSSYVLLNYSNTLDDVSTLAHEMWHAIHWWFSQSQPRKVFDTWLCLAETASVFNELIFADYIKSKLSNDERLSFLSKQLESAFSTIFRQVQYVQFERKVHQSFYDWIQLTYLDFNNIRRETQLDMSWDSIDYNLLPSKEASWSWIPHIFWSPFYCYSYAFWNILSFALYQKYLEEWKSFIPKYKKILKSGWSLPPRDLLLNVWIDIDKKEFYENWIKVIKDMLSEMNNLIKNNKK